MGLADEILESLNINEGDPFKYSDGSDKANNLVLNTFKKRLYAKNSAIKKWPHFIKLMLDDVSVPDSSGKFYGNISVSYDRENLPNEFGYDVVQALQTSLGEMKKVLISPKYSYFKEFSGKAVKPPYKKMQVVGFEYEGEV